MNTAAGLDVIEQNWNKSPVRLSAVAIPDLGRMYQVLLTAVEPFRAGTRFLALPDVRFFLDGAHIAAPGDLLPGPSDPAVDRYLDRMDDQVYVLTVEQPLFLDFPLWSQVRNLVAPLWRRVGVPVLPVISEVSVVHNQNFAAEPTYAVLAYVLCGSVRVDIEGSSLHGTAGDLLYWPGGHSSAWIAGQHAVLLQLRIPVDRRLVTATVKDTITFLLKRWRSTDSVPYLPYPPVHNDDGTLPDVQPLAETRAEFDNIDTSHGAERALLLQWAKRVSAGGLEPVPSPRVENLVAGQRVRLTSVITRMPYGDDWVWAINGYAFSVRGAAVEDLTTRLLRGDTVIVDDDTVLPLLRKLYGLRAIDVTAGEVE